VKRTDLLGWRDFLWAAAKSGPREGLLGVSVVEEGEEVLVVLAAVNCEVRSVSWVCRRGSWDVMDLAEC
jgi:hypothetical protein